VILYKCLFCVSLWPFFYFDSGGVFFFEMVNKPHQLDKRMFQMNFFKKKEGAIEGKLVKHFYF
jgi:hypothetical protein